MHARWTAGLRADLQKGHVPVAAQLASALQVGTEPDVSPAQHMAAERVKAVPLRAVQHSSQLYYGSTGPFAGVKRSLPIFVARVHVHARSHTRTHARTRGLLRDTVRDPPVGAELEEGVHVAGQPRPDWQWQEAEGRALQGCAVTCKRA